MVLRLRDKGCTTIEAAEYTDLTPRTVINICGRYRESGLDRALHDDPRPGRPPKFDARVHAHVVATVCSDPPEGFDRWTLELLKERIERSGVVPDIGRESLRIILREHDLKPWQQKMWCVAKLDDAFIERMEDVLDVYERPYNIRRPVVCLDEKPVVLRGDVRPPQPLRPGRVRRVDFEYTRNGTANVFCLVEPRTGRYMNRVTTSRDAGEFARCLAAVARLYPKAERIVLVMDNLSTHSENSCVSFYGEEKGRKLWKRFEVHYTPKHGSWLNQAEISIGMFHRQCLRDSRIPDTYILKRKTRAWNRAVNRRRVTINWRFSKFDARDKFGYR